MTDNASLARDAARGGCDEPYDYAFAGGGIAGLALACALADRGLGERIVIVDDGRHDGSDRTLAYFSDRPRPTDALADCAFTRIAYATEARVLDLALGAYRYVCLRESVFRRDARARLARHPHVTFVRGAVTRVEGGDHLASLVVDDVTFSARWVFDSRATSADPRARRHDVLAQRFVGWEIELDEPRFDPRAATLFHFADGPDATAVRFYYVLPFSPTRALVEVVSYGAAPDEVDLARYVARLARGATFTIVRREGGESLLSTAPFTRRLARRVVAIGVTGGLMKPSTGYALTRMLDDARAVVRALDAGLHPLARTARAGFYRFLDGVFLHLVATRPAQMPAIFTALFTRNPAERVARFLDERASLRDLLALVLSLPKRPFLVALAGWAGVRVGLLAPARQLATHGADGVAEAASR